MSIVLWVVLICYVSLAVTFNLAFLYFYKEEKQGWTGNEKADKFGMSCASALWPVCLVYGLCKMSKEDDKETK